jgi:hypothetical protein
VNLLGESRRAQEEGSDMDPDATWAIVNNESADREERDQAALDLLAWIANGGFSPVSAFATRAQVIRRCRLRLDLVLDRVHG